ncbi:MAG: GNAT family N-acetyltransferase [Chloroflexota bacterium]
MTGLTPAQPRAAPLGSGGWSIRPADLGDRARVSHLLDTAHWRHQHLDWFEALDLLGQQPFLLALDGSEVVGCLACRPERPEVAWIRVFAVAGGRSLNRVWELLWPEAEKAARRAGAEVAAALPTADWLPPLIERSGFAHLHDVVFLEWPGRAQAPTPTPSVGALRPMQVSDMAAVALTDARAFAPIWRLSEESLRAALAQSASASVVEVEGRPVGYQISTASAIGAHLARLAVDPGYQGRGLGTALVADALRSLVRRGFHQVTVNTQSDNGPSLKLYARLGFLRTGRDCPVYWRALSEAGDPDR